MDSVILARNAAELAAGLALAAGERRVAVLAVTSERPEVVPAWAENPGFAAMRDGLAGIAYFNEMVFPRHPLAPVRDGRELWDLSGFLRSELELGTDVELLAASPGTGPALTVARMLRPKQTREIPGFPPDPPVPPAPRPRSRVGGLLRALALRIPR